MEIIRRNTKKADRKKKEGRKKKGRNKSPLKHFSGLKSCIFYVLVQKVYSIFLATWFFIILILDVVSNWIIYISNIILAIDQKLFDS